jgi:pilus assembly protein CpaF
MEADVVTLQEIFAFQKTGIDSEGRVRGAFVCKGIRPHFIDKVEMSGVKVSYDIFDPTRAVEI